MFSLNIQKNSRAYAVIRGGETYPDIKGQMMLRTTAQGVVVSVTVTGLPKKNSPCGGAFLGFHIHEGGSCTKRGSEPFADTGSHYDTDGCTHPYHAGDMPPLLNAGGMASMSFLTDRFTVGDVIGKTVVIHSGPDDFTTQPAGNSGMKIACGVIRT